MTELKPVIMNISEEEAEGNVHKAIEALDRDDMDEYDRYCKMLPVHPESANDLKKSLGIEALIATGVNLYRAVEAYGEQWLEN